MDVQELLQLLRRPGQDIGLPPGNPFDHTTGNQSAVATDISEAYKAKTEEEPPANKSSSGSKSTEAATSHGDTSSLGEIANAELLRNISSGEYDDLVASSLIQNGKSIPFNPYLFSDASASFDH